MKDKVIQSAVINPWDFPWKRYLKLDKDQVLEILKEYGLEEKNRREKLNKLIRMNLLKESKVCVSPKEVVDKVILNVRDKENIEIDRKTIKTIQKQMSLYKKEALKMYKDLFKNNDIKDEFEKNIRFNFNWLIDICTFYFCSKEDISLEELIFKIEEIIRNKIKIENDYSEEFKKALYTRGLNKEKSIKSFKKSILGLEEEILSNFREIENLSYVDKVKDNLKLEESNIKKEEKLDDMLLIDDGFGDISDSILNLTLGSSTILDNIDDIKNHNNLSTINNETKREKDIEEKREVIEENIVEVTEKFTVEEVTITKDKYNKLIENNKEKEIKIFKELAHSKNGYVLSELYNGYKSIDSISKENLEIILSNFFNALNNYGFEVMENNKVGDKIEVNTKNLLKEFIFTNPIDKDGQVFGEVEYLGWSYKEKQVVPMVIRPNK